MMNNITGLGRALILLSGLLIANQSHGHEKQRVAAFAKADKEMMVPVEGGRVYVRLNGFNHTDVTPAVFIHGGPGGTHNKFASMLGLANERPVILYDQLDSGKSDHPNDPKNWRVARFVEELEAVRKASGAKRLHLIGHSWGSAIALEYAVRYPERVASTVLGGTFISTPQWIKDASLLIQKAPENVRSTLRQCESKTPPSSDVCNQAFITLYSKYYIRPDAREDKLAYDKRIGGQGFNPVIYNGMWGPSEFSSSGNLKNYDAVALLQQIDGNKTLFLIGQYDSARIDTVQEYVELAPGAELAVVPGASHGYYSDRPIETQGLLRGWLKRNDPAE